ncbi:MAG: hypothetical protein BWY63_02014 [Chloroflexi bacterium ADurb.Bin360]|nr:MAG: hypothetical protein BWY63_02014 [Chloroflexi bacterium ADurb.Bin360]
MAPQPTDQRRYRHQTENRLLVGVVVLLVVGGSSLIWIIFGKEAGLSSLLCLIPGAIVVVVLWLLLSGIERLTRS